MLTTDTTWDMTCWITPRPSAALRIRRRQRANDPFSCQVDVGLRLDFIELQMQPEVPQRQQGRDPKEPQETMTPTQAVHCTTKNLACEHNTATFRDSQGKSCGTGGADGQMFRRKWETSPSITVLASLKRVSERKDLLCLQTQSYPLGSGVTRPKKPTSGTKCFLQLTSGIPERDGSLAFA